MQRRHGAGRLEEARVAERSRGDGGARRRLVFDGREVAFVITPLEPRHRVFGTFSVGSGTGRAYEVEIRSLKERIPPGHDLLFLVSRFGSSYGQRRALMEELLRRAGFHEYAG